MLATWGAPAVLPSRRTCAAGSFAHPNLNSNSSDEGNPFKDFFLSWWQSGKCFAFVVLVLQVVPGFARLCTGCACDHLFSHQIHHVLILFPLLCDQRTPFIRPLPLGGLGPLTSLEALKEFAQAEKVRARRSGVTGVCLEQRSKPLT